jgi:hypothetical protein
VKEEQEIGKRRGGWEKKSKRQGGKCRREESDGRDWIEENGWEVLNGSKQVDKEEKWTYVGSRGETVIDYAIVNEKAWKTVGKFTIAERVELDHLPLEIIIYN